jgi:type IV fimbrial biogenesis protein FimT
MRKNSGFTMVELFITMAVMGILSAIAIPQLMVIIPNYELRSVSRDMFSHLQFAKLTAVKRNENCAITFTKGGGDAISGYTVYIDLNKNYTPDADEEVITSVDWREKNRSNVICKEVTFNKNDDNLPTVVFPPIGIPKDPGGNGNGKVSLSNKNGLQTDVLVSRAGNVRIKKVK